MADGWSADFEATTRTCFKVWWSHCFTETDCVGTILECGSVEPLEQWHNCFHCSSKKQWLLHRDCNKIVISAISDYHPLFIMYKDGRFRLLTNFSEIKNPRQRMIAMNQTWKFLTYLCCAWGVIEKDLRKWKSVKIPGWGNKLIQTQNQVCVVWQLLPKSA